MYASSVVAPPTAKPERNDAIAGTMSGTGFVGGGQLVPDAHRLHCATDRLPACDLGDAPIPKRSLLRHLHLPQAIAWVRCYPCVGYKTSLVNAHKPQPQHQARRWRRERGQGQKQSTAGCRSPRRVRNGASSSRPSPACRGFLIINQYFLGISLPHFE
jgi:hypothetical protein